MPFGLANCLSVFQYWVNNVLREHIDKGVVIYIDDILIYAKIEQQLIKFTRTIFKKFENNTLYINAKKYPFYQSEVKFVWFIIGQQ